MGYVNRGADPDDKRAAQLTLSALGSKAMSATSVLDAARVAKLLSHLIPRERSTAIAGLSLLAEGAQRAKGGK